MKKVIIIGGGVAGFTAGTYLRANGYETLILEKNAIAGGACIGWERQGCYIDGCIHWLAGSNPSSGTYKIWRDTHAITHETKFFEQDDLMKMRHSDGTEFTYWTDLKKLEEELLALSPEDEKEIKKFLKRVRRFQKIDPPANKPIELMNIFELIKLGIKQGGDLYWVNKFSKLSARDYVQRFKSPYIRDAVQDLIAPHYNFMSLLYMLGHISGNDGGIPQGGSIGMVERMEKRYLSLGGQLRKGAPVSKINVENNAATGVTLKNGEVINADWVVAATPIEHTLVTLLENKYRDKALDERLASVRNYPIYTYTTTVFRCPRTLADKSLSIKLRLNTPITINRPYSHVTFRNYMYDDTLKGSDKYCVIQATIHSDDDMYHWWRGMKAGGRYKQEKQRVADEMLALAKTVYPDIADEIEVIDVITPCTYERYLNSRHGCFQGFIHTKRGKSLMQNGRIKGLKGFILAGQWIIQSGGLPAAGMSGRYAAQRICHSDKKKFKDF